MKRSLQERIAEQRKWIDEHGWDRAGYLDRYGEQGSKIYDADLAHLEDIKRGWPGKLSQEPCRNGRATGNGFRRAS